VVKVKPLVERIVWSGRAIIVESIAGARVSVGRASEARERLVDESLDWAGAGPVQGPTGEVISERPATSAPRLALVGVLPVVREFLEWHIRRVQKRMADVEGRLAKVSAESGP